MTSVSVSPIQNQILTFNIQTPVQKRVNCSEPECTKTFANKNNLTKHKDKFHILVNAVSKCPIVNTMRTLFSGEKGKDTVSSSTQGTSDGSINSPIVEGTYQFTVKEALVKHKGGKH